MILFEIPFSKLDLPSKLPHSNGTRRCRNGRRKLANPKSSQTTTKESNTASAVQWKHSKHSTQILDPHQTGNGDNLLHSLPRGWRILAYRDDGDGDGTKVFPVQCIDRERQSSAVCQTETIACSVSQSVVFSKMGLALAKGTLYSKGSLWRRTTVHFGGCLRKPKLCEQSCTVVDNDDENDLTLFGMQQVCVLFWNWILVRRDNMGIHHCLIDYESKGNFGKNVIKVVILPSFMG